MAGRFPYRHDRMDLVSISKASAGLILLLVAKIVKRQIFSGFEFEVLDCFFEFGHGLGPFSDGQSYHKKMPT